MALHDYTFYDLIERNAVCFNHLPAWREADDGRCLSFAEVKRQVDGLAAGLRRRGIGKGERIGVVGKNSLEYFLLYGAAAALGAVVLPVNWRLSPEEMVFNLADGAPKALFADPEFHPALAAARERLPSVAHWIALKPQAGEGFEGFDAVRADPSGFRPAEVGDGDGLAIIHTAAVAGRPRGALLSHRNFIAADVHLNLLLRLSPADVHLGILPLFHVGGLFMATMAFHAGALTISMGKFDAGRAVELIAAERVTVMFDFAPILGAVLDRQAETGADIGSLQHVIGLEAPETIERYQRLTGGTFYCMYGQTETSAIATFGRYRERPGSAGRTIPLAGVRLVDEADRDVPAGEVGEIAVKGPMVFNGYWNLPEETAQAFRGGWHHTGDLGRFDADGFLFYAGRKPEKELIKPGGENVYPAEVETVIMQMAGVSGVCVFGVPDARWGEAVKAVVEVTGGAAYTPQQVSDFVGTRIARFKRPSAVAFTDALPRTAEGAVDRDAVKARWGTAT
jgi:long-chain acyl-CoA synthetase